MKKPLLLIMMLVFVSLASAQENNSRLSVRYLKLIDNEMEASRVRKASHRMTAMALEVIAGKDENVKLDAPTPIYGALMNTGLMSYGLTVGSVKKIDWFVSVMSNFNFDKADADSDGDGNVNDIYLAYTTSKD